MPLIHPPQSRRSGGVRVRKFAVFFFWVSLIFSHFNPSSSLQPEAVPRSNIPRKTRLFNKVNNRMTSFRAAKSASNQSVGSKKGDNDSEGGDLYDEDKRLVHTGPNPLHN